MEIQRIGHSWIAGMAVAWLFTFTPALLAQETASEERPNYTVQAGDMLQISVWREPELQGDVIVRPDGGFSFPLVGEIDATNMTVQQIQEEVSKRLSQYIPDPGVTVALGEIRGNTIYVMGQVNEPGEFVAARPLDVIQALSMAGGMTEYASQNKIKILRRENGKQIAIPFRYGDVEKGKKLEQNIILRGGDIIVVP